MTATFILYFLLSSAGLLDDQEKPLTVEYLNTVDAVCIVTVNSKTGNQFVLNIEKVFKGLFQNPSGLLITKSEHEFVLGNQYLMFMHCPKDTFLLVDQSSRIIPIEESKNDIEFLLKNIKCFDETRKGTITGACTREYIFMCGCDGKDYGNPCEAYKEGLNIYSFGKCPN